MRWQLIKIIYVIFYCVLLSSCHALTIDANRPLADNDLALAVNYLQRQQWDLAKQYLINAQVVAPDYSAVWYIFAYYEEKIGHLTQAEFYYQKALALVPVGAAHNNYGVFLCRQHRYREALQQFYLALKAPDYLHRNRAKKNSDICKYRRTVKNG